MRLRVDARATVVAFLCAFKSLSVLGQALPLGVTPSMVDQLKSMSPAQQEALARQYNITLPVGSTTSAGIAGLSAPGAELPTPLGMTQDDIEEASPDKTEEVEERARTRYGRTLFSREVSTFAPTDNAPVSDSYRLGVGDHIVIQLFGKENDQLNLQIGRSGAISFPKLGSLTLSGLTFEGARELIKTRVEQQLIGVEAVVSMGRLRAINVFMAGEVAVPGAYSVSALTTVTQALFQAGGVTDIGSLRNIQVRRAGSVVATFDTYDLLLRGDVSDDVRLQSGDVVFVPPYTGVVDVEGELKRPMVYEVSGGETLGDVLAMAGSFTRDAYPSQSILTRKSDSLGIPQATTIDLLDISQLSMAVQDGDKLVVPKVGGLVANSVTLVGAVTRPGSYGWTSDMRVSDLIGNARRDLARDADLSLGLIIRQKNALLDIEVISFDLMSMLASPKTVADPTLKEFDEVLVFSLVTSSAAATSRQVLLGPVIDKLFSQARQGEPVQTVSVSGAVSAPGTYPLIAGATVATLISAAGGLKESAFLEAAEVRQLNEQLDGQVVVSYREVDISPGSLGRQMTLSSRDHLTIRGIPNWSPTETVRVEGEVRFPGDYRIRNGERLSDVIARAGGFTDNASLQSAVLTREAIASQETKRAAQFARDIQKTFATRFLTEETTRQGIDDISKIISMLGSVEGSGRLLIDLPAAMSGDLNADLEVENGDLLFVPVLSHTVSVVGEVNRQGTHSFQSELSVDDYIDLSAGVTRRADENGIYIVKANGSVVTLERKLWSFAGSDDALEPGDTIVIPINTQYKESLASWQAVTQIIYQSMVSIAAVASL